MRSTNAVKNIAGTLPWWRAAYHRRTDCAIIGDSECFQLSITGYWQGLTVALSNAVGMYATPSISNNLTQTAYGGSPLGFNSAGYGVAGEPAAFSALRPPTYSNKINQTQAGWPKTVASCTFSKPGATTGTITRGDGGDFSTDGYAAGRVVRIAGAANQGNNGVFAITVVTAGVNGSITYSSYTAVAESGASLTLTMATVGGQGGCTGNDLDWCGTLPGNLNTGNIQLGVNYPLDLHGPVMLSAVIWRPSSGGITQTLPTIHDWGGGAGQYELNSANRLTTACPARSADGIDEVRMAWPRGAISDVTVSPSPGGANYFGSGARFRLRYYDGTATGIDGTNTFGVVSQRVEDNECFTGTAVNSLYAMGGGTTRDAADDLCNFTSDAALALRLRAMCMAQRDSAANTLSPMLNVFILMGANDANDSAGVSLLTTTGAFNSATAQAGVFGNTAAGQANNTLSLVRRIWYAWTTVLGYTGSNLCFTIGGAYPEPSGSTQWSTQGAFRTARASVLAAEPSKNITTVDGFQLFDTAEMAAAAAANPPAMLNTTQPQAAQSTIPMYRNGAADYTHLNEPGYLYWGQRFVQTLLQAAIVGPNGTSAPTGSGGLFNAAYSTPRNRNQ